MISFYGAKVRLSERKCKFICKFPNRWSSESHHASMFGRVVTEENKVSVSTFGEAKGANKRANYEEKAVFSL